MRVSIPLPEGERSAGAGTDIALSPDGTRLAYVAVPGGHLVLRSLDALDGTPIPETQGARQPVFSPDGDYVAFIRDPPGSVGIASISGAVSVEVVGGARLYCLDWASDGMLYFGSANGGIGRVSPTGGEPEQMTVPDTSNGERAHNAVHVLPHGNGALFVRWRGRWDDAEIAAVDLASGEVRPLVRGAHPMYVASWHLVYVRSDSVLMAAPFDQDRMEVTGQAEAVLDHVPFAAEGTAELAVSESGSLLYKSASEMQTQPVWVDRSGSEQAIDRDWPQWMYWPALSPNDARLAISVYGPDGMHIWIKTLDRGPLQRLTSDGQNGHAMWTPDGRFVTYWSNGAGRRGLWQKAADGSGAPVQLSQLDVRARTSAWSPDGRWLLFTSASAGNDDIYAIRPDVDSLGVPLVASEFNERSPALSPDGRWLAYSSNLSGRFEVYVRPFPNVDQGVWQVSVAGGTEPRWAHNGLEVFYVNGSQELVVADVEAGPPFRRRAEHVLFSTRGYRTREAPQNYAVSHDDQRFIMDKLVGDPPELILVFNFFEELNRRRQ
jgi:serine/threonine-protein kinase